MKEFFKKYHSYLTTEEKSKLCEIITGVIDYEEKEVPWCPKEGALFLISKSDAAPFVRHIGVQIQWEPEFMLLHCITGEPISLNDSESKELEEYIKELEEIIPKRL